MVLYFIIYGFTDFVSFEYNHDLLVVKYKNMNFWSCSLLYFFQYSRPSITHLPRTIAHFDACTLIFKIITSLE